MPLGGAPAVGPPVGPVAPTSAGFSVPEISTRRPTYWPTCPSFEPVNSYAIVAVLEPPVPVAVPDAAGAPGPAPVDIDAFTRTNSFVTPSPVPATPPRPAAWLLRYSASLRTHPTTVTCCA